MESNKPTGLFNPVNPSRDMNPNNPNTVGETPQMMAQQSPFSNTIGSGDAMGNRQPTFEEAKAHFNGLPIEEKQMFLFEEMNRLNLRLNSIGQSLGELERRSYDARRAFESHTHPQLGMGPYLPAANRPY